MHGAFISERKYQLGGGGQDNDSLPPTPSLVTLLWSSLSHIHALAPPFAPPFGVVFIRQHAYLSEHVITPELKNAMRDAIRDNRAKHARHKSYSNFEVIRRCTNMW